MTARQLCDRDSIAGFTLLEVLVATALMGLILAALATITAQWLPNWNRGLAGVQRSEQIALGLDRPRHRKKKVDMAPAAARRDRRSVVERDRPARMALAF